MSHENTFIIRTLQYEKHRFTAEENLKKHRLFITVVTTAVILFVFAYKYYPTPKEQILSKENEQIKFHLATVHNKVDILSKQLEPLHEKIVMYRMIFGIKPMDEDYWNGGIGGHNKICIS
ncbi:MAG: hypothetical protein IPN97_04945 [Saprospiraceae bacterium]|nr:hypothetical protein [Saprospiraceae bacterium]